MAVKKMESVTAPKTETKTTSKVTTPAPAKAGKTETPAKKETPVKAETKATPVKTTVAKKAPVKKTAVKKTPTKKAPAKRTTRKATAAKTELFIQFAGYEVAEEDLVARAKKVWVSAGNKVGDMKSLSLYVKPEEYKAYFVINGTFADALDL